MIEITKLFKSFGKKKVFEDFSFKIEKGERVSLAGPSGCGKTTLLRIISGLDKKYEGNVKCEGKVSYMFQEDRLFEFSTLLENVLAVTNDEKRAKEAFVSFELSDYINSYPSDLSGGMKRRVALIRALLADSDVLLLDEPFVGLDEELKLRIIPLVSEMIGKRTLILVTHSKKEAELLFAKNINL